MGGGVGVSCGQNGTKEADPRGIQRRRGEVGRPRVDRLLHPAQGGAGGIPGWDHRCVPAYSFTAHVAEVDVDIETGWNVNGADLAVSSATLSSVWFNQGDAVICTVTPTDGTDRGDSLTSTTVVIGNTPPVLASVDLSPAEPTEASVLTCTPGITTDADGTLGFGYEYAWLVNDIEVGTVTDTLTGIDFDRDDTVACRVTPNDGDDDGDPVTSATVTVQNTAPTVATAAIGPDPAIETDTLTCSYTGFSDADGDGDLSTIAWMVNSIDADGTKEGYDLYLTRAISEAVNVPVVASGGAGTLEHLYQVVVEGKADAVLAASIFHFGTYRIAQAKEYLAQQGVPVRLT